MIVARLFRAALAAATSLGLGGTFYLLCRAREVWFVSRALAMPAVGPSLRALRFTTLPLAAALPGIVVDVLPDALWAFAVGAMLRALDPGRRARRVWGVVGGIAVVSYEVAQHGHLVPGTFDWRDLLAQVLGFGGGWVLVRTMTWRRTLGLVGRVPRAPFET